MHVSDRNFGLLLTVIAAILSTGCRNTGSESPIRVDPTPFSRADEADAPPKGLSRFFQSRRDSEAPSDEPSRGSAKELASLQQQVKQASATKQDMGAGFSFSDNVTNAQLTAEDEKLLQEAIANLTPEQREHARKRIEAARAAQASYESEKIPALQSPSENLLAREPESDRAANSADQGDDATDPNSFKMPKLGKTEVPSSPTTPSAAPESTASEALATSETPDDAKAEDAKAGEEIVVKSTEPSPETAEVETVAATTADTEPTADTTEPKPTLAASSPPAEPTLTAISEADLIDELIARYQDRIDGNRKAPAIEDVLAARTLNLLRGNPDQAIAPVRDWTAAEQDYLNHQMLTLWQMIDPKAHPVRAHRWELGLTHMREATSHLAAATGSLDVRALQFCKEVNGYGQTVQFEPSQFTAGQQVILYCEVENFTAERLSDGFETHLKGSYQVIDASGNRVAEQALAEDRQASTNYRRDYFLAYILYLPKQLDVGNYRLELTLEDMKGKKFGQASIPLEIIADQ